LIKDSNTLLAHAMTMLDDNEQGCLVKISCAVQCDNELPKWYMDASGKFWLDDIDQFRIWQQVPCTLSAEYRNEWYTSNCIQLINY
jgi:hypothetical protein